MAYNEIIRKFPCGIIREENHSGVVIPIKLIIGIISFLLIFGGITIYIEHLGAMRGYEYRIFQWAMVRVTASLIVPSLIVRFLPLKNNPIIFRKDAESYTMDLTSKHVPEVYQETETSKSGILIPRELYPAIISLDKDGMISKYTKLYDAGKMSSREFSVAIEQYIKSVAKQNMF